MAIFRGKLHFTSRKSATKFLCVNTVSDKVVRHSLAFLSVQKWLVGDVLLKVNFLVKVNHPLVTERMPAMPISNEISRNHLCLICIATITMRCKIYNNAN